MSMCAGGVRAVPGAGVLSAKLGDFARFQFLKGLADRLADTAKHPNPGLVQAMHGVQADSHDENSLSPAGGERFHRAALAVNVSLVAICKKLNFLGVGVHQRECRRGTEMPVNRAVPSCVA